ncbi:aminotransferase, partial [Escherichia coli]|nr:aminotransferase [Escherichia coli]
KYLEPGGRVYEQREYCYNALQEMDGVSVERPDAAFYMFVKLDSARYNIHDDEQFALDLLRDQKLLIVHGKGFNWQTPG